jgi:predicted homoserine dehydrogenase-like protein
MLITDSLSREIADRGRPIRVAMIGAGVTGKMIALQLLTPPPGIKLVAIANRTVSQAEEAWRVAGMGNFRIASSVEDVEDSVDHGVRVAVSDASLVCRASNIDVVVEVTGTVEFALHVVLQAIQYKKHVVLVNAELDSTLGPILKHYARRAGVVITNTDGDEPGVAMTLLNYLQSIGLRPVAAGNLKGMIDPYRTPATQAEFAKKNNQSVTKVTGFADGTKLSMEATVLANATGFTVGRRGMFGPTCDHVSEMGEALPADKMLNGGIVDYALGAAPHTGAFVIIHEDHELKKRELAYYKMGKGPFYVFYTPFHLPHIQIASTILRAALRGEATVAPSGPPVTHVLTVAKQNLHAGDVLDGIGGFSGYGVIDNAGIAIAEGLLPIGLSEGCCLRRNVEKDQPISFADVVLPPGRMADAMWKRQCELFGKECPSA